jgi:hypothetical protein
VSRRGFHFITGEAHILDVLESMVHITTAHPTSTPMNYPYYPSNHHQPRRSIVRIKPVLTLRTSIENRRPLVGAAQLHFTEHQLRMMALRTLFVGGLLRVGDGLRDFEGGEVVAFALESGWVVCVAGGCG